MIIVSSITFIFYQTNIENSYIKYQKRFLAWNSKSESSTKKFLCKTKFNKANPSFAECSVIYEILKKCIQQKVYILFSIVKTVIKNNEFLLKIYKLLPSKDVVVLRTIKFYGIKFFPYIIIQILNANTVLFRTLFSYEGILLKIFPCVKLNNPPVYTRILCLYLITII